MSEAVALTDNTTDAATSANYSDIYYREEGLEEKKQRYYQAGILFIISALGLALNVPIIVLLCWKRYQRKKPSRNVDFLILHLSVADVLVAAFCVFGDAVWKLTYRWSAGNVACKIFKYMQMFSLYASTFIIVAISLDRCLVILNPLPRFNQHLLVKILVLTAWILALLFSSPQILIFRVEKAPFTIDGNDLWQCCTHGAYSENWQEAAYVFFTFLILFAAPLLIVATSYTMIFVRLNKSKSILLSHRTYVIRRSFSSSSTTSMNNGRRREQTMIRARRKALMVSVLVIVAFVVCWAPYHIAMIYFVIIRHEMEEASVINALQHIFFFGMSNSVLNPLIYGAFHFIRKTSSAICKQESIKHQSALSRSSTALTVRRSCRTGKLGGEDCCVRSCRCKSRTDLLAMMD